MPILILALAFYLIPPPAWSQGTALLEELLDIPRHPAPTCGVGRLDYATITGIPEDWSDFSALCEVEMPWGHNEVSCYGYEGKVKVGMVAAIGSGERPTRIREVWTCRPFAHIEQLYYGPKLPAPADHVNPEDCEPLSTFPRDVLGHRSSCHILSNTYKGTIQDTRSVEPGKKQCLVGDEWYDCSAFKGLPYPGLKVKMVSLYDDQCSPTKSIQALFPACAGGVK